MKIAYLYQFKAYPPTGGNKVHAYQLIRHFKALGHEVSTLWDDSIEDVASYGRSHEGALALCEAADVLYVRVDSNRISEMPIFRKAIETVELPMVWEINAPPNEMLAFSYLGGSDGAGREASTVMKQIKRRLHAWRQYPGIWREDGWRRSVASKVFGATCVSQAIADYSRIGLGIQNAQVIPNAADPITHRPDGPKAELPGNFHGHLTVLYAGSPIYPWQGLGLLRETILDCEKRGDPIRFVLLMNQEPSFDLTTSNSITRVGVPHEEVAHYLRAVDSAIVIHPEFYWSRWGSHGSPMKLFDYMACGTPVVASNVGQLSQIVKPFDNGILFDNTAAGLRDALLRLYEHREELPAMGRAARQRIELEHNWENVTSKTADMLEAAIQNNRTRRLEDRRIRPC